MRSRALPLAGFSSSGMSRMTMSPSSFWAASMARIWPICPPPTSAIFLRMSVSFVGFRGSALDVAFPSFLEFWILDPVHDVVGERGARDARRPAGDEHLLLVLAGDVEGHLQVLAPVG